MSTNPLVGAGWGASNQQQQQNPLPAGLFNLPQVGTGSNPQSPGAGQGPLGNPGGFNNPYANNEIGKNVGINNVVSGQLKNILGPQFAQLMSQYGGSAGQFFQNLQNLGSPYYQQKQQESFTQGQQQNQNASAQAQQQVARQGYGYTPSGAGAAVAGQQAQAGAQSLSEQFLQNLFQNENLQMQGAQGLAGLAGIFNPAPLFGGSSAGYQPPQGQNVAQQFTELLGALFPGSGGGGK